MRSTTQPRCWRISYFSNRDVREACNAIFVELPTVVVGIMGEDGGGEDANGRVITVEARERMPVSRARHRDIIMVDET